MTAPIARRTFLRGAAGLGVVLVGSADAVFGASPARAATAAGYGRLVPDPKGLLALPEGFSYTVVARSGVTKLETGQPMPSDPDGTVVFRRPGGGNVLVINHEIKGTERFPVPALDRLVYDPAAGGGTTTLVLSATGKRLRHHVSLGGTVNNCAGGLTPWSTWLTCEETDDAYDVLRVPHGYVFEVDPFDEAANLDPVPIRALGRYPHEAVAVDPVDSRIYLTEDAGRPNGLLYRFTPPAEALPLGKGSLRALAPDAGQLEALRALTSAGDHVPDLAAATAVGTTYQATWVPVPDREAMTVPTRMQLLDTEVTRSRKLEGMWHGSGGVFFVASYARTTDGSTSDHDGQVWFLDPVAGTIRLTLLFAYTPGRDTDTDGPDNITVSPYGGVILAENGTGKQHLVGANAAGQTYRLARNELDSSEFTGPAFSPDGRTLYANIQQSGHVLRIRGPFSA